MKQYTEFKLIKANFKKEIAKQQKEFINYINKLTFEELKENYHYKQLTEKQQTKTFKEIKNIIIEKEIKQYTKRLEKFFEQCDIIAKTEPARYISIEVNWAKNRTWGNNPTAEIRSAGEYTTGRASGCGYDKLSSAIREALNKNNHILNLLYNAYEKALRKDKNISLRDSLGYGSGYKTPYFEGGVGYSCFKSIFNKLGAKINTWQDGKTWDSMTIEF